MAKIQEDMTCEDCGMWFEFTDDYHGYKCEACRQNEAKEKVTAAYNAAFDSLNEWNKETGQIVCDGCQIDCDRHEVTAIISYRELNYFCENCKPYLDEDQIEVDMGHFDFSQDRE